MILLSQKKKKKAVSTERVRSAECLLKLKENTKLLKQSVVFNSATDGSKAAACCCCFCIIWNKRLGHIPPPQELVRDQPTFITLSTENGFIAEDERNYQLPWYHTS